MAIFLRLFILAFLFELGMIYSIQAETNNALGFKTFQVKLLQNQHSIKECKNPFSDLCPYELIEKDEQNEINEEDSHNDYTSSFIAELCNHPFFPGIKGNLSYNNYNNFFLPFSLPLFVVFHSWKFHI